MAKVPQQATMNILIKIIEKKKIESISKEIASTKKDNILTNTITKAKNSEDGLGGRIEQRKESVNWKAEPQKLLNLN